MRVLITGIGGSGKTTTVEELNKRGDIGIDLDKTGLCYWENKETGRKEAYTAGAGSAWIENHSWKLDISALRKLLSMYPVDSNVYIAGKIASSQFEEVSNLFDKIFLLRPSDEVLAHRQSTRTNKRNNFAMSKDEQEHLRTKRGNFEKICMDNGAVLIDADQTVEDVTSEIQMQSRLQKHERY